jgi:Putative auto-transporter adhesin, head GIN domain
MKPLYFAAIFFAIALASCMNPFHKTIRGNGNITTSVRNIQSVHGVRCAGSYDVQLTQGSPTSVKIETDENLQPYIVTEVNGDGLTIRTKEDVNVDPSQKTRVYITTDRLEEFRLSGSGTVNTQNKFTGGSHLDLNISGSGNMHFDVNTPKTDCNISGSGDIYLTGETRNSRIDIAGTGNYHAEDLKSETVTVKIAGAGDAHVFADSTLDINIAGVGNVFYKGNASVTQNIAGTGKIKKIE